MVILEMSSSWFHVFLAVGANLFHFLHGNRVRLSAAWTSHPGGAPMVFALPTDDAKTLAAMPPVVPVHIVCIALHW